jgi:hypothetical protein
VIGCINLRKDKPRILINAANNVYALGNTGTLFNYFHKAMFSSTRSALIKAMKQGQPTTWPGVTEDAIINHMKMPPATAMCHMDQKRQDIRSSSKEMQVTSDLEDEVVTPVGTGDKTHLVYAVVIYQGQLYTLH